MPTVKPPNCTIATSPGDPKHADELLDEAIWESFSGQRSGRDHH